MSEYQLGSVLGDCPSCNEVDGVIYRGGNEGVCKKCTAVCEIDFDDPVDESQNQNTPPKPSVEAQKMSFDNRNLADNRFDTEVNVEFDGTLELPKNEPEKTEDESLVLSDPSHDRPGYELGIPKYILKTRAWKHAQIERRNGNPYRPQSKNWKIFQIASEGLTVSEIITKMNQICQDECQKLSFLLTVYEVLSTSIAAGLLIINTKTGKIRACPGEPKPAQMP